ncbi:prepilin-type N-terminal cleavage/methylation domain-containing protein [bacterium]|jgi:prepilin-type N-terminal cleavage/methylation domain-containing protein|nr:prepilin-type N-terminal cleavage/methylation domain-containing protein [bacterium]MBT4649156.1 prepilin-type N-terminal cleavage/methylation domain-containing protein [bacterium]
MKDQQGVTMIELLVAIAILAMVSSLSFATHRKWQEHVFLTNQVGELRSAIVKTQQLAIASAKDSAWGVHFEAAQYTIFSGSSYSEIDPNNEIYDLQGVLIVDPEIVLSDGIGGFGSNVIFSKFTGQTVNTGTIALMPEVNPAITKSITIYAVGQID